MEDAYFGDHTKGFFAVYGRDDIETALAPAQWRMFELRLGVLVAHSPAAAAMLLPDVQMDTVALGVRATQRRICTSSSSR